ncbi:transglycosylase family protein [Janibacter sp. GXQ6167]|uniref:transglycosylase family protein n=1 Tax=Janibacter sp. GXQ6167 TaxID=3240791 RepID=UPI0035240A87
MAKRLAPDSAAALDAEATPKAPRQSRRYRGAAISAVVLAAAGGGIAVATSAGAAETVWDRVAQCESGQNWSINTGNGYYGGLQFSASTWTGFGGGRYAPTADRASKGQQIEIAQKVLRVQGPGAWPVCSRRAGLTVANGLAVDPYGHGGNKQPSRGQTRPPVTSTGGKLVVDGVRGSRTNAGIEMWVKRPVNGTLDRADNQALQRVLGVPQDGVIGPQSTRALQRKVGADVDGKWGPQTTSSLQRYLNRYVIR